MAREHWAFARDHMEEMKKNLLHEFRRIEVNFYDHKKIFYLVSIETIPSTYSTNYYSTHF
jgi:hypothetical protein